MKFYICSGSFHLKKKTKPSSFQSLQGKDLPIVTRTHGLAWSYLTRKLDVFQVTIIKRKKIGMWYSFRNRLGVWVILLTNLCSKCWPARAFPRSSFFSLCMVSLSYLKGSSCTLPETTTLLPLGFVPTDLRGPSCSWYTALSEDHLHAPFGWCVIIHFDNFVMITRAESKFSSLGVCIWTVSHLQAQI